MAWTEDDISRLKDALASGQLRIRTSDGRQIEYRTVTELQRVLTQVENEVSPRVTPSVRRLKTRAGFSA